MDKIAAKVLQLAEQYRDYSAQNLSRLVRIKSLTAGEKEMAAELKKQMADAGFAQVRLDGLGSVHGRVGTGKRLIAVDAHIDTVDQGNLENWSEDPFSGRVADGFVHGRGSVDQKGGAAAMVTAGRILAELGVPNDLTVLVTGTVMEEDCDGLCWKYIIEEEKIRPELVIITEPTALGIYRGHRGRMEMRVSFKGLSAHGSAPERGQNAIYMGSRACLEIEKLNERLKSDDFLGKGSVTVSEFVSGSPSLCAVADFARIHLDRRLTAGETKETALAEVRALVKGMPAAVEVLQYREKAYTGKEYSMEKYYPTWKLEPDHPAVARAETVFRSLFDKEPRVDKWTFSTNAIAITGIHNIPCIGFGPGDEVGAHAPNEKVPIDDLVKAAAFYALYALQWSGTNTSSAGPR
ncbi:MAG: YgeY family selenium metabolism-linked hydrolase [Candidatus Aminicenantes bacterium]|nr:YgeY family selenium metabolism-linked hydrolase [Candidatus Aminicenantes bacterium]